MDDRDKLAYLQELAVSHFSDGNLSAAVAAWQQVLQIDPTNAEAQAGLAKARPLFRLLRFRERMRDPLFALAHEHFDPPLRVLELARATPCEFHAVLERRECVGEFATTINETSRNNSWRKNITRSN